MSRRQAWAAPLFLAVAAVLIFSFALGPERPQLRVVAPGLLWIAAAFAAVFALGRAGGSGSPGRRPTASKATPSG